MIVFGCYLLPGTWVIVWHLQRVLPGLPSPLAYAAFAVTSFLAVTQLAPRIADRIPEGPWLLLAFGLAVVLLVGVATPEPDALRFGSDRNEALTLATSRLLAGQYPYSEPTSLGVRITPMPGALFISAPTVALLGNAAFQNAVALLLLIGGLLWLSGHPGVAVVVGGIVGASPYGLYQILVGEDLFQNAVFCAVALLWLLVSSGRIRWLAAVAFGVALSWRPNFAFLVPVVVAAMLRTDGCRTTGTVMTLAALGFAAVTLPFLLPDPARFSPMHVASRAEYGFIPYSDLTIPLAFLLISLTGALMVHRHARSSRISGTLLGSGAVIGLQALAIFGLNSVERGGPSIGTLGYVIFAVPFLTLGTASSLGGPERGDGASSDDSPVLGPAARGG